MIRKTLVDQIDCQSNSPFIGAELTIKAMLKGYRVGEVGIQTFPREFGKGASTSPANIAATISRYDGGLSHHLLTEIRPTSNRTRS